MTLVRVVAPHFVAAFETDGVHVVVAAPILKYLIGRTEDYARHYIKQKGWVASRCTIGHASENKGGNQ